MPLPQLQPETQYVPTGMYDITKFPANSFVVKYIDPVSGNVGKAAVLSTVSGGTTTYSILIGNTQYQLAGYQTHYADVYTPYALTADICDPADINYSSVDLVANPTYQWRDSFGTANTGPIQARNVYLYHVNQAFGSSNIGTILNTAPSNSSFPSYANYSTLTTTVASSLLGTALFNGQMAPGPCPGVTTYGGWPAITYNGITYSIGGGMVSTTKGVTLPWKSAAPQDAPVYSTWSQYNTRYNAQFVGGPACGIRYSPTGTVTLSSMNPGYLQMNPWQGADLRTADPFQIWRWPTSGGPATSTLTVSSVQSSMINFIVLLTQGETFQVTGPYGGWSGYFTTDPTLGMQSTNFASEVIGVPIGGKKVNFCFRAAGFGVPSSTTPVNNVNFVSNLSLNPTFRLDLNTNVIAGQGLNNSIAALSTTNWFTVLPNPYAIVLSPYTGQFTIPGVMDSLNRPVRIELLADSLPVGKTVPGIFSDSTVNNTSYQPGSICVPYQLSQFTAADLTFLKTNLGIVPITMPDAATIIGIRQAQISISTSISTVQNAQSSIKNSLDATNTAVASATKLVTVPVKIQDPGAVSASNTANAQVPAIQGYITSLQTSLASLQAQYAAAHTANALPAFQTAQTAATNLASTATNNVAAATNAVNTANAQITTIQGLISSMSTASNAIQNAINSINTSLNSMNSSLTSAKNSNSSVASLASLVSAFNDPNINAIVSTANTQSTTIQGYITNISTSLATLQTNYTAAQGTQVLATFQALQTTASNLAGTATANVTAATSAASTASAQVSALQQAVIAVTTTSSIGQLEAQAAMYLAQANGYNSQISLTIAYITIYGLDIQLLLVQTQSYASQAPTQVAQINALLNDVQHKQMQAAQTAQTNASTAYSTAQTAVTAAHIDPTKAQVALSVSKEQLGIVQTQYNTATACQNTAQQNYQNALKIYNDIQITLTAQICPIIDRNLVQIATNISTIQDNLAKIHASAQAAEVSAKSVANFQDTANVTAAANAATQATQDEVSVQNAFKNLQPAVDAIKSKYSTAKTNQDIPTLNMLSQSVNNTLSDSTTALNLSNQKRDDATAQATTAAQAATTAKGVQDGSIHQLLNNAATSEAQVDALVSQTLTAVQQISDGLFMCKGYQANIQSYDPNASELVTVTNIIKDIQESLITIQQASTSIQSNDQLVDTTLGQISTGSPTLTEVQTALNTITKQLNTASAANDKVKIVVTKVTNQIAQSKLLSSNVIARTVGGILNPIQEAMCSIHDSITGIQAALTLAQTASSNAQNSLNAVPLSVGQAVLGPIQDVAAKAYNDTTTISALLQQTTSQASPLQALISTAQAVLDLPQLKSLMPTVKALQETAEHNLATANAAAADAQTQAGIVQNNIKTQNLLGNFISNVKNNIGSYFKWLPGR